METSGGIQRQNSLSRRTSGTGFGIDASLDDLRMSLRVSDGGSLRISKASRALSFMSARRMLCTTASGTETYITCLIDDLRTSLQELGADPSNDDLEKWAILIHECLSGDTRKFHSVHHVFEISAGCEPIQLIAAFFRDCISIITDGNLIGGKSVYMEGVFKEGNLLTDTVDTHLELIMDLFQLAPGTDASHLGRGLDVFLSAVLCMRVLRHTLNMTQLAQIATCMEATIPFRDNCKEGKSPLEQLEVRLLKAVQKYQLDMTEHNVVESIQRAADLANRNLGNFATPDAATFLDHTWSLLPEQSVALRRSYLYTVNDFQLAAHSMEVFLANLNTDMIFQSFHGIPDQKEMTHFAYHTQRNLDNGKLYLRAKLLSVCIIGAFATLTGGDAPMSFFSGDLPSLNHQSDRLGESFHRFTSEEMDDCNLCVYEILCEGLMMEQSFDTRNSPLSAYIYGILGDSGLIAALEKCTHPMTQQSSKDLLSFLPLDTVELIGRDIAKIAVTRIAAIEELLLSYAFESV